MKTATLEKLKDLQRRPDHIRNICILAHVDHGKTTLADTLVASNGIISQRMAGKLRYLDSREDEQLRGITMKSSAISLHYQTGSEEYLINLIDSPGHVDFSSEVSTAVRLCDGAVVVVDVVEGVCPQTHAVLRQAWLENIKPVLVLNKMDRLITELKMDPTEAFIHLQQILEQVNLVTSELFTADVMSLQVTESGDQDSQQAQTHDWTEDADEMEHKNIYFSPDQGNVVFACAYDGWAFTIGKFAEIYAKKLGMNEAGLRRTLWGDFYLHTKSKRILKGAQAKGKKPLFVQFVLESIWSVYDCVTVRKDKEGIEKIVSSLGLKISARDLRHTDTRIQLQAIMNQWLPMSHAVLSVVVDKLPSPLNIEEEKVEKLMCNQTRQFDSLPKPTQDLKQDFLKCQSEEDVPVIVFVSKMFPVDKLALPKNRQRPLTEAEIQERGALARERHAARLAGKQEQECSSTENNIGAQGAEDQSVPMEAEDQDETADTGDHVFVAFARVYSGTVKTGKQLYVLGPKHDPAKALQKISADGKIASAGTLEELSSEEHVTVVTVTDLYLFMGRELELLDEVPAGNILGIGGLEDHVLNTATVASTIACPAFTDLYLDAAPILRVALEPVIAGDMRQLVKGLRLLNQADPCVQVLVQETGEHVIITAGEVHLRKCIDDLTERYAKVELTVSKPIVPFRETIVPPPTTDMVNETILEQGQAARTERWKEFEEDDEVLEEGLVCIYNPSRTCMVQVRALPLPSEVADCLEEHQFLIKTIDQYISARLSKGKQKITLNQATKDSIQEFKDKLDNLFTKDGKQWKGFVNDIWAFGPKRVGPNLLVNRVDGYQRISLWDCVETEKRETGVSLRDFDYSIVSGFQLATLTGPLCDEPLRGLCFIVEKWVAGISSKVLGLDSIGSAENENSKNIELKLSKVSIEDTETDLTESNNICATSSLSKHNEPTCENGSDINKTFNSKQLAFQQGAASENVNDSDVSSMFGKKSDAQLSGQLISIMKEACRKSFQTQPQRLMVAMYKCNIQATVEVLGKLFAVIGKRNGRILSDEMKEGTQLFNIEAVIPVVESFGFAEDIRKKTSGLASPQLVFSHWEVVDVDPFWVPTTEEEIMHYGDKADSENRALTYMNNVRERKGLKVDKKIVEHAEKQRTLTRNK